MSTHNIGFYEDLTKSPFNYPQISNTHLGPVVQSIVSLRMSLRHQLVKYMLTSYANTSLFFVGKM